MFFHFYTEKARRVIFFARYEASQFGSPYIETEHILLGLLREDKAITNRILRARFSVESIRRQVEDRTLIREKISTSVDLPVSNECKRVLGYAAEEAERIRQQHIGTEHLLLGRLREKDCFAAQLLNSKGVFLDATRDQLAPQIDKGVKPAEAEVGEQGVVEIHGEMWDQDYIETQVGALGRFVWRRRDWEPDDILVEEATGRISFDLANPNESGFRIVKGGWLRDLCQVCEWELNATGGPEHSIGYTNGRDWVCVECYEKFLKKNAPRSEL